MSATKNPYEIRLELLKLAKDTLFEPIYGKREELMSEYHSSRETFVGETEPRNPKPFPTMPAFPSTEDIVRQAEKLKAFVDAG